MHFIYYINRSIATKVDSTYLGYWPTAQCVYVLWRELGSNSWRLDHRADAFPLHHTCRLNDLPNDSNLFNMLMHADNTTLFCNMTDTITVDVINEELSKICDWLVANKLSLNTVKTNYMLYHYINISVIYLKLKININNIDRITQFNFLWVILHERMSWKQHIEYYTIKDCKNNRNYI